MDGHCRRSQCARLFRRGAGWRSAPLPGPDSRRPQAGRIGVEAENDLTATLLYERRKPVGEGLPGTEARVNGWVQPRLTAVFSAEPALNRGTLLAAISIRSPVCGLTP